MNKLTEQELNEETLKNIKQQRIDVDGNLGAQMATEILSLREQLAELKALELIGQVISCNGNKTLGWINDAPEGTLLFAIAKPVEG